MNDDDDTNSSRRGTTLTVIPIIGMGGIGKTTLAQLVYNDPRVRENFEMRGWVCVSDDFDVVSLTRKILGSFTGDKDNHTELNKLQLSLRQLLEGKKFLLVMDDVWNEDPRHWELLKQPLVHAGVAGRIIVTTQNESIATFIKTVEPVNLSLLSFDESWKLFKKIVFDPNNVQENLVEIGREIVKKCKGLPLAVKVLGSALRYEDDENYWMDILESELWEQDEGITGQILPALKISYDCMPTELKRCFKYLSLFPKDKKMKKQKIVHLWMSQGLVQASSNKQAEDIGYDYLKSLLRRSILQQKNKRCVIMHDLMNDLAKSIASDECVTIEADKKFEMFEKVRHLRVDMKCMEQIIDCMPLGKQQHVRTIFIGKKWYPECTTVYTKSVLNKLFENLKCIRALDLSHINIDELPDSIGNLKLLRYLSIQGTPVESLPDSMCSLYNLQTLDVVGCSLLAELPRWIINLSNLRHIFTAYHSCLPRGIGQLTNLQTLEMFCLGNSNSSCELAELNGLQNLRGRLTISVEEDADISGSETPLKTIHGLEKLDLRLYGENAEMEERLLECLQPHANLKELYISAYCGIRFAEWVSNSSFFKLVHIELNWCVGCKVLPPLGQLPSLETLNLNGMDGIQHVGQEFCANDSAVKGLFPSLTSLSFSRMSNWEVWDGVKAGDFPNLLKLEIYSCGKLREFPGCLFFSLKKLELWSLWSLGGLNIALPALHFSTTSDHDLPSFPLEHLVIENCSNLRFASGLMNKFTSLHHLEIRECPHLQISLMERLPSKPTTVYISGSPWVEEWYHQHTF